MVETEGVGGPKPARAKGSKHRFIGGNPFDNSLARGRDVLNDTTRGLARKRGPVRLVLKQGVPASVDDARWHHGSFASHRVVFDGNGQKALELRLIDFFNHVDSNVPVQKQTGLKRAF